MSDVPNGANWLNSREELDAAVSNGAAVVLFTAPAWCQPCIKFEPVYLKVEQAAKDENYPVKFYRVDIDNNQWAMVDFHIQSVPTCYLFVENEQRRIKVPQSGFTFLNDISDELGV